VVNVNVCTWIQLQHACFTGNISAAFEWEHNQKKALATARKTALPMRAFPQALAPLLTGIKSSDLNKGSKIANQLSQSIKKHSVHLRENSVNMLPSFDEASDKVGDLVQRHGVYDDKNLLYESKSPIGDASALLRGIDQDMDDRFKEQHQNSGSKKFGPANFETAAISDPDEYKRSDEFKPLQLQMKGLRQVEEVGGRSSFVLCFVFVVGFVCFGALDTFLRAFESMCLPRSAERQQVNEGCPELDDEEATCLGAGERKHKKGPRGYRDLAGGMLKGVRKKTGPQQQHREGCPDVDEDDVSDILYAKTAGRRRDLADPAGSEEPSARSAHARPLKELRSLNELKNAVQGGRHRPVQRR
jgi:hypothetical protein